MASNCCHYHHNNATNTAACLKRIERCTCRIAIMGSSSGIHTVGSMTKNHWKCIPFSTASQPDEWVNLINEPMRNRPSQRVTINDLFTVNVHKAHCPMATPLKITAKASQPSHPLHELFRFSKINLLFPFLHLDIVCVTSIQRRGSKGRSVCVCGNEFPLSLPLVHAYRLGTYFRVLNCICLCLLNVKFSTKCYLPKNSISYSVMNIHYVNFNPH